MNPTTPQPEVEDQTLSVQYRISAGFPDGDLLQFSGQFDIPCAGDFHGCHLSTQHAFNQFVDSMLNDYLKQAFSFKLHKWRAAVLAKEAQPPAQSSAPAPQQSSDAADEPQTVPPNVEAWDHLVARAQPGERAA
jgi:hypothetical protein